METLKLKIEIPAAEQKSLFAIRQAVTNAIHPIGYALDVAEYPAGDNARTKIRKACEELKGEAGSVEVELEFDLVENERDEIMHEIKEALPSTHTII